ncbi:hypothetical protein B9Q06_01955 [Candidatus Marsarchaeota G2 archaeon ECH_B_2]|uniref:Uncharacterized protein n=3 Tax=Candidatus Marsarchaeota group 2 TaxID=2203771 RepID=A0A2R6BCP7_9ARCH|nr:MAG: hypothetical protein B9Q06_01955 [Candidatus Marsarchaeota G2 archaeon ECH_B_2]PSO01088.1 MAG: hypothetical protein B9Q07_01295 [Candidatus Marsarchaeota G2 archaeon ECH_B_3]PSO03026.1 MAG: hypothetical protein B9Q05_02965 [Candidatus Marsarchaeota G2 archaeon ECH_B_1]
MSTTLIVLSPMITKAEATSLSLRNHTGGRRTPFPMASTNPSFTLRTYTLSLNELTHLDLKNDVTVVSTHTMDDAIKDISYTFLSYWNSLLILYTGFCFLLKPSFDSESQR